MTSYPKVYTIDMQFYYNSKHSLYFAKNSPFRNWANIYYFSPIKNDSVSFFSSFLHHFHHLVRCHVTGINSWLISVLNALRCFYLLEQIKSNMNNSCKIMFMKISISRLIFLRSALRTLNLSLKNVTLPESSSKKNISSSMNKVV